MKYMMRQYDKNGRVSWREAPEEEFNAYIAAGPNNDWAINNAKQQEALRRSQGRWKMADKVAWGVVGGLLGGSTAPALLGAWSPAAATAGTASVPGAVGASAAPLGGGTVASGLTSAALPSTASGIGTTAGYGSLFGGSAAGGGGSATAPILSTIAGGGGGAGGGAGAAGAFSMADLIRYGAQPVGGAIQAYLNARSNNRNADKELAELSRQFGIQQAFLVQQHADKMKADADIEAEKKRQFDALEEEKRRRYEDRAPIRQFALNSATRMSDLLNEARPQRVAYQPTFQYRP